MGAERESSNSSGPFFLVAAGFLGIVLAVDVWRLASDLIEDLTKPFANQQLLGHIWWRGEPFWLESLAAVVAGIICLTLLTRVAIRIVRRGGWQARGLCESCGYPTQGAVGPRCNECGLDLDEVRVLKRREHMLWGSLMAMVLLSSTLGELLKNLPGTFEVTAKRGEIFGAELRQNDLTSVRRIGIVQVATWRVGLFERRPQGDQKPLRLRVAVESLGPPRHVDAIVVRLDEQGRVDAADSGRLESLWRRNGAVLPADVERLKGLVEPQGLFLALAANHPSALSWYGFSTYVPDGATSICGVFALILVFSVMCFLVWLDLRLARRSEERQRLAKLAKQPEQDG